MIQIAGVLLKLWHALQNNVVLVHLRVHRVDLPLAERVIEGVIDCRWRDPQPRSAHSIDHQGYGESSQLLIRRNIFQFGQLLEPLDEAVRPLI